MNRRVILFGAVAMVVVLAGWYLLLWSPTKTDLDNAKKRTEAAQSQNAQLEAEISRLRSAQRSEPLNRAKLESLRVAIPDDPGLGQFIIDVNDAASKAGIDFISIAPSEPKASTTAAVVTTTTTAAGSTSTTVASTTETTALPATGPAEVAIQMQVAGGYFQVVDFLNRLDRMPRLVVTDSLNVSTDAAGRLTAGVTARMFVRAVPAGFAGAVPTTTTTTVAGSSTTTTAAGGATTTTAPGATTTTTGARP
jgi:Tfp pilus assembly protein PilO